MVQSGRHLQWICSSVAVSGLVGCMNGFPVSVVHSVLGTYMVLPEVRRDAQNNLFVWRACA